jgi:hypothetical protein
MFPHMETSLINKCSKTLRNRIYDDFIPRQDELRHDLKINCLDLRLYGPDFSKS